MIAYTFEIAVPFKDRKQTISIVEASGYTPLLEKNNVKINLTHSGEKIALLEKIKKAGIYVEVLQEGANIKDIKKMVALISKKKQALAEWEEWESRYDFNFSKADSYDIANANSKAKGLVKKYDLKAKVKESVEPLKESTSSADMIDLFGLLDDFEQDMMNGEIMGEQQAMAEQLAIKILNLGKKLLNEGWGADDARESSYSTDMDSLMNESFFGTKSMNGDTISVGDTVGYKDPRGREVFGKVTSTDGSNITISSNNEASGREEGVQIPSNNVWVQDFA